MPKPPLAKAGKKQLQNFFTTETHKEQELTSEALLRMADEGLANIDKELKGSQKTPEV